MLGSISGTDLRQGTYEAWRYYTFDGHVGPGAVSSAEAAVANVSRPRGFAGICGDFVEWVFQSRGSEWMLRVIACLFVTVASIE